MFLVPKMCGVKCLALSHIDSSLLPSFLISPPNKANAPPLGQTHMSIPLTTPVRSSGCDKQETKASPSSFCPCKRKGSLCLCRSMLFVHKQRSTVHSCPSSHSTPPLFFLLCSPLILARLVTLKCIILSYSTPKRHITIISSPSLLAPTPRTLAILSRTILLHLSPFFYFLRSYFPTFKEVIRVLHAAQLPLSKRLK